MYNQIYVTLVYLTGIWSNACNYTRCRSLGTVYCSDISICVHRDRYQLSATRIICTVNSKA